MTERLHLSPKHRAGIEALLREHLPDVEVWAYGSRVNGQSHDGSDLDLVLRGPGLKEIPASQLGNFEEAIRESNIPFLVEARDWARLHERFHREIERSHVVLVEEGGQGVAGKWKEARWGDLATLEYGRALRGYDTARGAFRVFGTNGPIGWHDEALCPHPSVVVGRKGAYRGIHYSVEPCFVIDTAFYLKPKTELDIRWAYYELLTRDINGMDSGSAIPSTSREEFYSLPVSVPPLSEQRAIAHILGTLDDKIELSRRMNETLEAMARALFKSWFIDFDPVRAKAALRNHSPLKRESASQRHQPTGGPITPPLRGSRRNKGASPPASRWGERWEERWKKIKRHYTHQTLQNAQTLRESQTDAEGLLWHYLRDKQLDGYKFRRQQPIGPYIVDFACMPQKLLIELDGSQHAEQHTHDQKRDAFLREKGYTILRFWNNKIFENCFGVLEKIYAALPHHSPLEGESAKQGRSPQESRWGDEGGSKDSSLSGSPPPHQPAPIGLASATPPQGGSDWTVERARAYLDNMDKEIAALFPDRLVDSELGLIPEGWEVKALDKIANFQNGLALQKFRPRENEKRLPVVKIAQLRSGRADSGEWATENITPEYIIDDGDVIFSWSGSLMVKVWCAGRAALNQHLFKVTSSKYPKWFYLHYIESHLPKFQSIAVDKTTTMGHIKRDHLSETKCAVPDLTRFVAANDMFSDLLEKRISNVLESNALVALRDALLPKLISGEICVRHDQIQQLVGSP